MANNYSKQKKVSKMIKNTNLGTSLSELQHSSRSPISIFETSKYGSQTVNPRPIKSTAALRKEVCAGNLEVGCASSKYANALPTTENENNKTNSISNF